jgi:hypothetical protein
MARHCHRTFTAPQAGPLSFGRNRSSMNSSVSGPPWVIGRDRRVPLVRLARPAGHGTRASTTGGLLSALSGAGGLC